MLVGSDVSVALNALPSDIRVVRVRHLEDPAVIHTDCWASVTTEDENLVLRISLGAKADSGVLGTRAGKLVTILTLLFPEAVL